MLIVTPLVYLRFSQHKRRASCVHGGRGGEARGALKAAEMRLISSFTSHNEIAFEEADNWQRRSGGKKSGLGRYF